MAKSKNTNNEVVEKDVSDVLENGNNISEESEVSPKTEKIRINGTVVEVTSKHKEAQRNMILKAVERAKKPVRCIITSRDPRTGTIDNDVFVSVQNQFVSYNMRVPLNIEVELPRAVIDTLEETTCQIFVPETLDGKQTGNYQSKFIKKFSVSYL